MAHSPQTLDSIHSKCLSCEHMVDSENMLPHHIVNIFEHTFLFRCSSNIVHKFNMSIIPFLNTTFHTQSYRCHDHDCDHKDNSKFYPETSLTVLHNIFHNMFHNIFHNMLRVTCACDLCEQRILRAPASWANVVSDGDDVMGFLLTSWKFCANLKNADSAQFWRRK